MPESDIAAFTDSALNSLLGGVMKFIDRTIEYLEAHGARLSFKCILITNIRSVSCR